MINKSTVARLSNKNASHGLVPPYSRVATLYSLHVTKPNCLACDYIGNLGFGEGIESVAAASYV
jgi:hypothetical protein